MRQVALQVSSGTRFLYWESGDWPTSLEWRVGDPYWEDSRGCTRVLRNVDGTVFRPRSATDLPATEPRVTRALPSQPLAASLPSPPDGLTWESLFSPGWRVGDTWVTQHRCPPRSRAHAREGAWLFEWPPPLTAELSAFAFYEVLEETADTFVIKEWKVAWRGMEHRRPGTDARPSPYESKSLTTVFRKRPFAVVRWRELDLVGEHDGGPCLNVGPNVDGCPFPMPADPPLDGTQPSSWIAKQTRRKSGDGVELDYAKPDGTQLTIRWKSGDPWPEASPSCTTLLRNPDGTVLRPGDVDAFLERWEASPEFKEEIRTATERRPSKLRDP